VRTRTVPPSDAHGRPFRHRDDKVHRGRYVSHYPSSLPKRVPHAEQTSTCQATALGHRSCLISRQRGPSSQVNVVPPFLFSALNARTSSQVPSPTLPSSRKATLKRSPVRATPSFHHRDGLTPQQVPSSSPARVSADQGVAFHTRTVELTAPVFDRVTEVDFTFPLEARRRAEDILVRNKSSYFFQVFSGVAHGFAVRCDLNVPHERASLSRVCVPMLILFRVGLGQVGQRRKVHGGSRSGSSGFRRDARSWGVATCIRRRRRKCNILGVTRSRTVNEATSLT
jgi:hypothetical protein